MRPLSLSDLNACSVAVALTVQGRRTVLRGIGQFQGTGEFGAVLRVKITEATGDFEILLSDRNWQGQVESGDPYGCDYAVQVDAGCLSAH